MLKEQDKLNSILQITHELFQIQDLDILLEKTLSQIRTIVNADAGSIYLAIDNKLKFSYAQNDTLQQKLPPGKKIIYTTFTLPINNESIAGYVANNSLSLNIEDAYKIASDRPYKFDQHFDEVSDYHTQSILATPIKTTRGKIVGVIQLINAKSPNNQIISFSHEHELLVQYFADNVAMVIERAQMVRTMIMRMVAMATLRDPKETGAHTNRVAAYAAEIYETWARSHNIDAKEIEYRRDILKMAALLHDVGKVAIPDAILKKPGKLTPEERKIMEEHSWRGATLFIDLNSDLDDAAKAIALNHHEKWDGTGYPGYVSTIDGTVLQGYQVGTGKKGEEIPFFGQIVAIADVYDALSCRRCYKEPFDEAKVLAIIKSESGKQFNPEIVAAFLSCLDTLRALAMRYPESYNQAK